jgi:hypothetical protein
MPMEYNPNLFDFARVEGRAVPASFDGGAIPHLPLWPAIVAIASTVASVGCPRRFFRRTDRSGCAGDEMVSARRSGRGPCPAQLRAHVCHRPGRPQGLRAGGEMVSLGR